MATGHPEVDFHCGNSCSFDSDMECPQIHWCQCCGDCLFCYGEPCYDGCSIHGFELKGPGY